MIELHHNIQQRIEQNVSIALNEDVGDGDLTAALVPENTLAVASVLCRENAIIAGQAWFNETLKQVDASINIHWHVNDADSVSEHTTLCDLSGSARSLLTAERCALNFLQTLSATATQTRRYVDAIKHTKARILDTRKTLPGLRDAQKYAVLCGGGKNHRRGLYDGILIKENHILAAGSLQKAVQMAKTHMHAIANPQPSDPITIEVEIENLGELEQALSAGADIILLDNMETKIMTEAVAITQGKALLEASGGITLKTIATIAETGVDFISIGDLTKNIQAIDLSMRFRI